ncbi:phospholipid scramblase 1 [Manduca sexta]|uniref:Phospholipid scramblase n=1 Tax=Manduca sexta TaxID=7130 RepID=A0A922CH62_MANSE|nr:phospholipid scramblase 1 [Manduca sexta]KAG6445986.1 hypothetical protein O3G_MSEX004170 [Manduca sexta]
MDPQQAPLGIRQLISLDRIKVRQKTTVFEGNKYVLMTPDEKVFMYAKEDAGALSVMLGGKNRAFHMDLLDTEHQNVVALRRPYTFGADKLEVRVCGQLASVVRQEHTFMKPVLNINDAQDRNIFRVKGPMNISGECDFRILTRDKKQVGVIRKVWGGFMREAFSQSDNFEIAFPLDLDVRIKAAIIGTCFLIDFLYFEK